MHEGAYRFISGMVARLEPRCSVIELGSRTVAGNWPYSGPVRPLFDRAREYTGVDIAAGPNVDIVADAATPVTRWWGNLYPVDTVVCCETLEHTPEAQKICANARRLLVKGGVFLVTTAADGRAPHSGVDGGPLRDGEFYRNIDANMLRCWLAPFGFTLIDENTPTDIYALAVRVQ
jgi:methyltransferase family protein